MWLLLAAALVCDPPSRELHLLVLDPNGTVVRGAELRRWSGSEPREALLAVTHASGSLSTCVWSGMGRLGVYVPGFRPKELTARTGRIVVKLECATGSTTDGGYRFCSDALSRMPLRD